MAVYYKFKSAKDFDSIPIDGHFISIGNLKEKIFETKHLGRGTDFDLVVTNAQTNEEYLDEAMLIPKNTSVLIRRVPGRPRMPIVTEKDEPKVENKVDETQPTNSNFVGADSSAMKYPDDSEWDEFGNDLYAIPEVVPVQSSNPVLDAPPPSKADEDSKIKALIDTPALDWQRQGTDGFGPGRGFGRGIGGRMMGGRGFGRIGLERKTPPQGYICHRCKVPGHFIQHCPTNGDPTYDIKRVKPPTGIPKSMLMATPDGSYALPSGAVAVLKPNEAAFEKEIEGLPSTRSVGELPPELHCPLCKEVMKDAVLTSKCCFKSFCYKCIRDHIISKSMCVCGATNILADDLLPNKTLRDTINRILESNNSSAENAGSALQVQDMESARCPQPKIPSPTLSAASKGEQMPPPQIEETLNIIIKPVADESKSANPPPQLPEKGRTGKAADVSEATLESMSVKELASQGSAPLAEEEVQQKLASGEAGKKKKKKKARVPVNAADIQWKSTQDLAAENYMMPMDPTYAPYWNGMQPGMDGFMNPYAGAMPYMGYGYNTLDMPFGGVLPQGPFGAPSYMLPVVPPQRDLADFGMGLNAAPPVMSREEFEARKADLRRRRESERRGESKEFPKDREYGREGSMGGDVSTMKPKPKLAPQSSSADHHHRRPRPERSSPERPTRDVEAPRPSKRKSEHHHHRPSDSSARPPPSAAAESSRSLADRKAKPSVFSRISFPEEEPTKKRKLSETPSASAIPNGQHEDWKVSPSSAAASRKSSVTEYESSDEDRHFKRKPSRYEPSPPAPTAKEAEWEEKEARHSSRGSREREREYDRDRGYSKHR